MRHISLLGLVTVLAFGCSDSKNGGLGSGGDEDMAVAADLAVSPDLAAAPKPLTCSGVIQCLMGGNTAMCFSRATPKAMMLLNALLDCGRVACGDYDGGPGSCTGAQDNSQECLMCVGQDLQGGDCMAETQACLADM